MGLPNLQIIGVTKSGTTSLYHWLNAHPQAYGAPRKEVWYLKDMDWRQRHTIDCDPFFTDEFDLPTINTQFISGYEAHFAKADPTRHSVIFEATPEYYNQKTAFCFFNAQTPKPLLVVVLRKPSARIYSYFQFNKNNNSVFDKGLSFRQFLRIIDERLPNPFGPRTHLIRRHSQYADYFAVWLDIYTREKIVFYLFEDLVRNPLRIMRDISIRSGIDPDFYDNFNFSNQNETYAVRNITLHRKLLKMRRKLPMFLKHEGSMRTLRNMYRKINTSKLDQTLSSDDILCLVELDRYFVSYNKRLAHITGLDLSAWES